MSDECRASILNEDKSHLLDTILPAVNAIPHLIYSIVKCIQHIAMDVGHIMG